MKRSTVRNKSHRQRIAAVTDDTLLQMTAAATRLILMVFLRAPYPIMTQRRGVTPSAAMKLLFPQHRHRRGEKVVLELAVPASTLEIFTHRSLETRYHQSCIGELLEQPKREGTSRCLSKE